MLLEDAIAARVELARVLRVSGSRVQVQTQDDIVWAENALAFPCDPEPGSRVLVIGDGGASYVIGWLRGAGAAHLRFAGDVALSAPDGFLTVEAGRGVRIEAPAVTLRAGRFELLARTVIQRSSDVYQRIAGLLQVRCGRSRSTVEGACVQSADRTYLRSTRETKIDGRTIHLG